MIKPWYQDDYVQLFHGDCRKIIPEINPNVDLTIIDPHYGMNYQSNHYKHGNPHKPIVNDDHYPVEMLKESFKFTECAVYSFCRWDNLHELPKPKSFIVWAKNNWTAGDLEHEHGRQWEGIAFYPMEGHKFKKRTPDIIDCRRIPPKDHPTEKPVMLVEQLILANEGETIMDMYCGVGTTAVAAKNLKRKCIGIEIEEKYLEIAKERLRQEILL